MDLRRARADRREDIRIPISERLEKVEQLFTRMDELEQLITKQEVTEDPIIVDEVDEDAKRKYSERLAQIFNQLASNK